jgi:PIN domain nuclease of toxin-antitoxin system
LKLLLDTHIWLWSLREPERLSRRLRAELDHHGNELWLSPVSTWEALLLYAKRKIEIPGDLADWLVLATQNLREAPLTHEIALAAHRLPWQHSDPADRLLVATAQVLDLTLVSADTRVLGLGEVKTLANR